MIYMKVSRNWLQTYFDQPLPTAEALKDLLTFHSVEVEEVIEHNNDVVFDLKILPDKAAWLLSHRGVAKELAAILGWSLKNDPLERSREVELGSGEISVKINSASCDYYQAAVIEGVKVAESPAWLKERLEAVGQRPINNIVDATNYVMLDLGQPLHAFAAEKLTRAEGLINISIRPAKAGEVITTLTGELCKLEPTDTLIVDANSDQALAIAGVKGGQAAAVTATTTTLVIESAHFNRQAVRKTARRLDLLTEAARRYENGVSGDLVPLGMQAVLDLIMKQAGGRLLGGAHDCTLTTPKPIVIKVSLAKINSVLGITMSADEVLSIMNRLGYKHELADNTLTVFPPWERDDLAISEDIIEEIGRLHGLQKIESKPPLMVPIVGSNKRYYYANLIRKELLALGFSEVMTSSFRAHDKVRLRNALAADKSYLRSSLKDNLREARDRNLPHRDLLGLPAIKIFEIGTVFLPKAEVVMVGLAVQTGSSYKAKSDEPLLEAAKLKIETKLGQKLQWHSGEPGVVEFALDDVLPVLSEAPDASDAALFDLGTSSVISYQPFSAYPSVSRDIAFWVNSAVQVESIIQSLQDTVGSLVVRVSHLDTFSKDNKTSLAFRLVFQAQDRTLTDEEVNREMQKAYAWATSAGFEIR